MVNLEMRMCQRIMADELSILAESHREYQE